MYIFTIEYHIKLIGCILTGIHIGFGEVDYKANENEGGVEVIVQKIDENFEKIVVSIKTLTFDELDPSRVLTESANVDPAECKQLACSII